MPKFKIERLSSPLDHETFVKKFKRMNGLRKVGVGAFAEVMAHPNHEDCYKIGQITYYETGEDAYLEFLKLIQNKKENPFFPKIMSVTIFNNATERESWYVVRMEKLKPWNTNSVRSARSLVKTVMNLLENSNEKKLTHLIIFLEDLSVSSKVGKNLIEAIEVVNESFKLASPDLHYGNMMMRHNGDLVITDPIAHLYTRPKRK